MKDDILACSFKCNKENLFFQIDFTNEELKQYYKTIRNNKELTDAYKLKIANVLLDRNIFF